MTRARSQADLSLESELLNSGTHLVAGMDEVGRGALAGPVTVGVTVVSERTGPTPEGLTDSKLLTEAARGRFEGPVRAWCFAWGVGHAAPAEIDSIGIVASLRLAGMRALAEARATSGPIGALLLDGSHDWLTPQDLLSGDGPTPSVRTVVKGDLRCASIAGASILAKCARDRLMVEAAARHPAYGWQGNKGYGAPAHLAALRDLGPSDLHRLSWRLPVRAPVQSNGA